MIHDFPEQLAFSEKASAEPFWEAVYKRAFPNMVNCMQCKGNTKGQRRGVDRLVYLSNDDIIRIDEKKRKTVWNDFCLEYISVDKTNAPGWMEKDLAIDYIAYCYMPKKLVYLLPWPFLKRAWEHYKEDWKKTYKRIEAENKGYFTISVAVPRQVVLNAITLAIRIQLPQDKEYLF